MMCSDVGGLGLKGTLDCLVSGQMWMEMMSRIGDNGWILVNVAAGAYDECRCMFLAWV